MGGSRLQGSERPAGQMNRAAPDPSVRTQLQQDGLPE
jgi:hypothetical protein